MGCTATGKDNCRCTCTTCERRGNCCQCVAYHRDKGEFTACFFSPQAERNHDRSFNNLLNDRN